MKKIITFLLCLILVCAMCAGCAGKESTKSESQSGENTTAYQKDPQKVKLIKGEAEGEKWDKIFAYWDKVNEKDFVNVGIVPDGLPQDDSLCIVVLGFQLNRDGSMKDELIERLKCAYSFAAKYENAFVLVTGGPTAMDNKEATEADAMAAWLIDKGISKDRILIENRSMTSAQNAVYSAKLIRQFPQIRQVAIATSDYHVPLGCLLFNSLFILDEADGIGRIEVTGNSASKTLGKVYFDLELQGKWLNTLIAEREKAKEPDSIIIEDNDKTEGQITVAVGNHNGPKMPKDVSEEDRLHIIHMIRDTEYAEINEDMLSEIEDEDLKEAVIDMFNFWDEAIWEDYPESDFVPEDLPDDGSMLIVIMGLELYPDGSMKDELIERLNMGMEAAKAYPKSKILVTGGGTAEENPDITEAKAMREYLLDNGIEKKRILMEDRAYNSAENAVYSLDLIKDKCPEVKGIMMVTSDYHAPWANLLFKSLFNYEKKLGGEDYTIFGGAYYGAPFAAEDFPPSIQQWLLESLVWNR